MPKPTSRRARPSGRSKPTAADQSIRDQAYNYIRQKIASGILTSGDPISEVEVAERLGSSRTPVREAIGQLVAAGLLEQTPGRGTTVARLTRDDIVDLYELREALEVFAAGKVARLGVPAEELDQLQQLVDAIKPLREELGTSDQVCLNEEQMARFMHLDLSFHACLIRMALNPRMQKIATETQLLIRIFAIRRSGHGGPMLDKIQAQHSEIVAALRKRQADRAMRTLSEHIEISLQERLIEFDAWNRARAMRQDLLETFPYGAASR
ncbi:MAG TPA: GntR family transcriptional regulator [Acidobacteriaceae bacterium]|nr:GntR family transcriptional regulator [Acidobacteriaceae bacterium]